MLLLIQSTGTMKITPQSVVLDTANLNLLKLYTQLDESYDICLVFEKFKICESHEELSVAKARVATILTAFGYNESDVSQIAKDIKFVSSEKDERSNPFSSSDLLKDILRKASR